MECDEFKNVPLCENITADISLSIHNCAQYDMTYNFTLIIA